MGHCLSTLPWPPETEWGEWLWCSSGFACLPRCVLFPGYHQRGCATVPPRVMMEVVLTEAGLPDEWHSAGSP